MSAKNVPEVEVTPISEEQMAFKALRGCELHEEEVFVASEAKDKTHIVLSWIGVALSAMSIVFAIFWYLVGKCESTEYIVKYGLLDIFNVDAMTELLVGNARLSYVNLVVFLVVLIQWNLMTMCVMFKMVVSEETLLALKRRSNIMHSSLFLIWVTSMSEPLFQDALPFWTYFVMWFQMLLTNFWIVVNVWMSRIRDPIHL